MILDLEAAHPGLIVSEDRKSMQYRKKKTNLCYNPRRFHLCLAILGSMRFNSGRHYWEVELENKTKWTLGMCQDSLPRKWWNPPVGQGIFWATGRYVDSSYVALHPKTVNFCQ